MRRQQHRSAGFTMIELLFATLIFSVILLTITVAVIRFSKQYYHGVIANATQNTARGIMDDIDRSIQFNGGDVYPLTDGTGICVGNAKLYSFKLNQQVETSPVSGKHQGKHALVVTTVSNCNTSTAGIPLNINTPLPSGGRELLGEHMRLAKFSITPANTGAYIVSLKIIYGDDDLLTSTSDMNAAQCNPGAGAEYCATSELTTVIKKRIQ